MAHVPALKVLSTCTFHLKPRLCIAAQLAACSVPRCAVSYLSDPANTGKRARGVNFDTLGSWNNRLELAIDVKESIRRGRLIPVISLADVGVASLDGRRHENEDRTVAVELAPNLLMFGIFDGHGGPEAVDYVVEHLAGHVKCLLDNSNDLSAVLRQSYLDVNDGFTKDINSMKCMWKKPLTMYNIVTHFCYLAADTHTHTHPFNGPLSGSTQVSRYQRGKTNLHFTEAKRQCVAVASAGPYASNHLAPDRQPCQHPTTQFFYRPDALPAAQPTASRH